MRKLRHYAAGATLGFALIFGGCSAPQGPVIPSSATLMSQGNNGPVSFRATESGRAYIKDDFNGVTLFSTDVNRGELIEVNPVDDEIRVNGRTASEYAMDDGHVYQIYFEPLREARTVTYRETVVQPSDRVIERKTEVKTEPLDRTVERKTVEIRRDDGTIERRTVEQVDPIAPRPNPDEPLIDPHK